MGEGAEKSPPQLKKPSLPDLEKAKDTLIELTVRFVTAIIGFYLIPVALVQTLLNAFRHQNITGFVTPPKERPLPPKVLTDFGQYKYIQLPNEWMFYIQNGNVDAQTIIFLHGFPDFWYSWKEQIKHYAECYNVIAVDLRGYGYSEKYVNIDAYRLDTLADDIKNLIQGISKDKKPIVISHDWGALVFYHFLLKYPDLVEKYVTISVFPIFAFKFNIKQILQFWYMFFFQLPLLPELYMKQYDLDCPLIRSLYDNQPAEVVESYKFVYSKTGAFNGPLAYYRANFPILLKYMIFGANYTCKPFPPGLVLYGDNDVSSNPASYGNVYKVPNLEGKEVKGGDHWLHQHSPVEVNKYIDEFLTGSKLQKQST